MKGRIGIAVVALASVFSVPALADGPFFAPGNLVVVVSGCGVHGGTCTAVPNGTGTGGSYGDNQATPLTLFQYQPTGTSSVVYVNSMALPANASGANFPVSAEYGSSSEGTLHLSGLGQYLTVGGYGINFDLFNANHDAYSPAPNAALAQSGSLTGQSYTPVARVVALIDQKGDVNSSTGLFNIFDGNNPRSVYTLDGTTAWISGQGNHDSTGGVFYVPLGRVNTAPVAITGLDTSGNTLSQDTRDVQIFNNTLYVSVDSKEGSGSNRDFIGALGTPPATGLYANGDGPTQLTGFGTSKTGKMTITTGSNSNGNNLNSGKNINPSPVNYFFARPNILYVADSGNPKNDANGDNNSLGTANIGNGGLQKWINSRPDGLGTWSLAYTLWRGLNLVNNGNTTGTSGLYGLAGTVNGNTVQLYATDSTLSDLDTTHLYGITDNLTYTTASLASGELFTLLDTAPADSNFKGVSFTPQTPNGGVTITSSPSGLAFASAGSGCAPGTYTTPVTLIWTPGSTCQLSTTPAQYVTATQEYALRNWEDSSTNPVRTVIAPSTPATYTANFDLDYYLTTAAGPGGSVSAGGFFPSGTNPSITATPSAGYYFVNFTGATTSTSNPLLLAMNGPQSITANFAPQTTPTITWPAPAAITFGSALSSEQLNAMASVPGTFTYTPPAGTVLQVGANQPLSVSFTPTDTTHYTTANGNTTITVNPAPAGPANLVVTKVLTRSGGVVVVQLTISNTGGTDATNVMLNSVKAGSVTGTPLPQSLGTIAAGASVPATVTVPGSVGAPGAASSLTVSGTYTGGTFSSTARITLP